jgi:hypothetical protein
MTYRDIRRSTTASCLNSHLPAILLAETAPGIVCTRTPVDFVERSMLALEGNGTARRSVDIGISSNLGRISIRTNASSAGNGLRVGVQGFVVGVYRWSRPIEHGDGPTRRAREWIGCDNGRSTRELARRSHGNIGGPGAPGSARVVGRASCTYVRAAVWGFTQLRRLHAYVFGAFARSIRPRSVSSILNDTRAENMKSAQNWRAFRTCTESDRRRYSSAIAGGAIYVDGKHERILKVNSYRAHLRSITLSRCRSAARIHGTTSRRPATNAI